MTRNDKNPAKIYRTRTNQYFAGGEKQLLISPGSVDLGGVFVIPRHEDFIKINKADIVDIFAQVTLNQTTFAELTKAMKSDLKTNLIIDL